MTQHPVEIQQRIAAVSLACVLAILIVNYYCASTLLNLSWLHLGHPLGVLYVIKACGWVLFRNSLLFLGEIYIEGVAML